ncbi:MAG: hypothetical protein ACPGWR_03720 [Ardenticatenaceae bacterium]
MDLHEQCGRFVLYGLDISPLVSGLRLPRSLPVLFLQGEELVEDDIQDLLYLLASHKLQARLFLLVVSAGGERLRNTRALLDRWLAVRAYEPIVVTQEEFKQITLAKGPLLGQGAQKSLRTTILRQVNLQTISPFVRVGPTPEQMFFGRESELRAISVSEGTRCQALIGGRRIGKTSLLFRLHRVELPQAGFESFYHDCTYTPSYESFIGARVENGRVKSASPIFLGHNPFMRDLLLDSPRDKPFILLLDEVDKLIREEPKHNWRLFKTLSAATNSGQVRVILSGERGLLSVLRDSTSPLGNWAKQLYLGRLSCREVERLVMQPMKQLEIEVVNPAKIVHLIYNFTSGHPNVVQRLCHRLLGHLVQSGSHRLLPNHVVDVINDPSFQYDDFLQVYWESSTVLEKIVCLLLADKKNEVHTLKSVCQELAWRCGLFPLAQEVKSTLQSLLLLRNLLNKTPQGYSFAVPSFPQVIDRVITLQDVLEVLIEEYQENQDTVRTV